MMLNAKQLNLQLTNRDAQVRLVESIRNVPAEWTKLDALLNECVKEAETKQQLLKLLHNVQSTIQQCT